MSISRFVAAPKLHLSLNSWILADGLPFVCDMSKSKGSRFFDAKTGRTFIDFFAGFGSCALGFNHPKLANDEFLQQSKHAVWNKPSNADLYTFEFERFVSTFGRVATPAPYKHLFFIDGGALAVENTLKTAFDWKVRQNQAKGVKAEVGSKVIHFRWAFHGRSGFTMSLTNTDPTKTTFFPKFDWPRVSVSPAIVPGDAQKTLELEQRALQEVDAYFERYGDDIAALIIEPIQCEGGDRHFRGEFLLNLQERCRKNGAIFIVDEVQTGFFTSGKQWCWQHFPGLAPDIWSFGKKAQVCGLVAGPRIDEVKGNVFETSSRINSTFGGNLMDMVRSTRIMEIIEEDKLADNAAQQGQFWLEGMQQIAKKHSFIINPRSRGLIMAFDLPSTEARTDFLHALENSGVLALKAGQTTIRMRPPLSVSREEVAEALTKIEDASKGFHTKK